MYDAVLVVQWRLREGRESFLSCAQRAKAGWIERLEQPHGDGLRGHLLFARLGRRIIEQFKYHPAQQEDKSPTDAQCTKM